MKVENNMGKSSSSCEKNGLKKGPWTAEEDQKLIDYIQKHGHGKWRIVPKNAGLKRCGKSCRLRWTNYLRPDIKRGSFSCEEEETIIHLHSVLGNKWSAIAARLPGRTDNEIKNYWNTHIKKRLLRMGIDPVTHCLRLDLLELSSILSSSLYDSSQFNSPSINMPLMAPVLNSNQLNLATALLSSYQHQNPEINPQNMIQENQSNCLQIPILNENQLLQAPQNLMISSNYNGCQNSLPTMWLDNGRQGFDMEPLYENYLQKMVVSSSFGGGNITDLRFNSLLSTPSSSSTLLNSSSTTEDETAIAATC